MRRPTRSPIGECEPNAHLWAASPLCATSFLFLMAIFREGHAAEAKTPHLAWGYLPPRQYTLPSSAPMTIAPCATAGLPGIGEPIS